MPATSKHTEQCAFPRGSVRSSHTVIRSTSTRLTVTFTLHSLSPTPTPASYYRSSTVPMPTMPIFWCVGRIQQQLGRPWPDNLKVSSVAESTT